MTTSDALIRTPDASARATAPLGHLLPLYVYPANLPDGRRGADEWLACPDGACGPPTYAIANVADGVCDRRSPLPAPVDPVYRTAVAGLASRGVRVLGYVDTGYGRTAPGATDSTDPDTLLGQVNLWSTLYPGIAGVFLDQVPTCGSPAERRAVRAVADRAPGTLVVNSGQLPDSDWLLEAGADLVVYEHDVCEFLELEMPAWTSAVDPTALGAILHDARSPADVRAACTVARARGFGFLYVTDGRQDSGNPYDGLPSPAIWSAFLEAR